MRVCNLSDKADIEEGWLFVNTGAAVFVAARKTSHRTGNRNGNRWGSERKLVCARSARAYLTPYVGLCVITTPIANQNLVERTILG